MIIKRLARFLTHPFLQLYDAVTPEEANGRAYDLCVLMRTDNGKYYRGSRWWAWCNRFGNAAYLSRDFFKEFICYQLDKRNIKYLIINIPDLVFVGDSND